MGVWPAVWFAAAALAAGAAVFLWALFGHRLLLYGDATAHLMIARRMVDSLTPGLSQWGGVWLPLPHLLLAPFVLVMALWRTGAAGSIVSLAAFALATFFIYRIARRMAGPLAAGWAAALFLLNPNLLYLAAVPMTETVYLAAFLGAVDQIGCYRATRHERAATCAALWALAGTLTRYDGWFCLPFFALAIALLAPRRTTLRFIAIAAIGPVFWLLYNLFYFGDALSFLRGPYSARHIQGGAFYPGEHNAAIAAVYYLKCAALDCGPPLLLLALLAILWWLARRLRRPPRLLAPGPWSLAPLLLLLPLPWYIWAMRSGNVPIFVPMYWPHGYYNLRYGVQLLPAAAVWSGLLLAWLAARLPRVRTGLTIGLALLVAVSYAAMLRGPGPMTYAEAVHNAPARLSMEHQLAAALAPRRPGERVLMFLGTYPGALPDDGIPLHDVVQEANFDLWDRALARPAEYAAWVVLQDGTPMARRIDRASLARYFAPVARCAAPRQPAVTVYRRSNTSEPKIIGP